jgi:hypothetical protein
MEATYSSETCVGFERITRRYIPEESNLHNHNCENLKSYVLWGWLFRRSCSVFKHGAALLVDANDAEERAAVIVGFFRNHRSWSGSISLPPSLGLIDHHSWNHPTKPRQFCNHVNGPVSRFEISVSAYKAIRFRNPEDHDYLTVI